MASAAAVPTATPAAGVDVVMGGTGVGGSSTSTATATVTGPPPTTIVSASLLATVGSNHHHRSHSHGHGANGGLNIDRGLEPRARCSQCGRRRTACHHHQQQQQQSPGLQQLQQQQPTSPIAANGALSAAPHTRPRRISKIKHRTLTATAATPANASVPSVSFSHHLLLESASSAKPASSDSSDSLSAAMEPPVLSFYGREPVPLPSRFAHIKRSLVAGREAELEASWARLIEALRDDVDEIASRGSRLAPTIDFADMQSPAAKAAFSRDLKRYGLGVIRGVVPRADAQVAIDETVKYLEKQTDFKEPPPQDPTCFDFFWTPAQVRTRAHPRVLDAQRFAMSLWDNNADDRMAIRFPIAYGDRLRIHGANIGGVGPDAPQKSKETEGTPDGELDEDLDQDAQKAAAELLGDFTSSTVIAQVDNGSLERWEPDGYGRGGTYDAVFKGEWEKYDPWDPTYRVSATPDLYNGYGSCSIFRMYQGVVALSTIEPGLIRLLPSPKLATAYFLLRPFFSPKTKPPECRTGPEWEAFLDPSNWALDKDQSTIIHGAVPGHAQRLTELWHPHLHIRRTLVTIPTLQTGDYIVWHPDLAYHITSNNPNLMASRAPTPPPEDAAVASSPAARPVSILVYVPCAPLTQTNALYLARQRKTFQRGHPGPDFDSTGSGLGSEATHVGRPTETDIAEVGGPAGLQAMGLAPFDVAPTPPTAAADGAEVVDDGDNGEGRRRKGDQGSGDVEMDGTASSSSASGLSSPSMTRAEAEVARLANIILFPDRYDFYMAKRNGNGSKRSKVVRKTAAAAAAAAVTGEVDSSGSGSNKKEDGKGKGKEVEGRP